jgi:hypothetical protein
LKGSDIAFEINIGSLIKKTADKKDSEKNPEKMNARESQREAGLCRKKKISLQSLLQRTIPGGKIQDLEKGFPLSDTGICIVSEIPDDKGI